MTNSTTNEYNRSMEVRLRRLELQLGIHESVPSKNNSDSENVTSRLDALEKRFYKTQPSTSLATTTTSSSATTKTNTSSQLNHTVSASLISSLNEIDSMMNELLASSALTHQTPPGVAAPMIYRKQEVLASTNTFKMNLSYVGQIVNHISIDNDELMKSMSSNKGITENQVVHAPIVVNHVITEDMKLQLQNVIDHKFHDLQLRTTQATNRLDAMILYYHELMNTVSEKLVIASETISQNEGI